MKYTFRILEYMYERLDESHKSKCLIAVLRYIHDDNFHRIDYLQFYITRATLSCEYVRNVLRYHTEHISERFWLHNNPDYHFYYNDGFWRDYFVNVYKAPNQSTTYNNINSCITTLVKRLKSRHHTVKTTLDNYVCNDVIGVIQSYI